jgi:hypothetical protein
MHTETIGSTPGVCGFTPETVIGEETWETPSGTTKSVVFVKVIGVVLEVGVTVLVKFTLPPGQIDWLAVITLVFGVVLTTTLTDSTS